MRSILAPAALCLALIACSSPESTNDASVSNTIASAGGGTDYVAAIRDMPEAQRRATFLRAIRDAGQACQQVVDDRADTAPGSWGVRCEDGRGWLIAIAPDGNAKVTGPVARK